VLCDRFASATLAYQGYGRGVDLDLLRNLASIATRGCEPDITLLVDVPVAVSRERVLSRSQTDGKPVDRLEREDADFHSRVRDGYLLLARTDQRIRVLDGTRVAAAVLQAAWEELEAKISA
jgi:dTMP kinase